MIRINQVVELDGFRAEVTLESEMGADEIRTYNGSLLRDAGGEISMHAIATQLNTSATEMITGLFKPVPGEPSDAAR